MKLKKKELLTATPLILLISSTIFLNIAASPNPSKINSQGTITYSKVNFLIRYVWIGAMKTASAVDAYVAEHSWGNAILLTDTSDGILSVISYTGYSANKQWVELRSSPTYAELKTVIDRFHYHGWKVIYSPGNCPSATGDPWFYRYLTNEHPELIFMDGNGKRAGVEESASVVICNFFANYSTPDTTRNIPAGSRLIDVYCKRLKQMISDRSFEWDGWFGVDGWNGLTQSFGGEPHYWLWSTNQPWGRWIGTSDADYWFDCSYQSINEWGNASSYYHPIGFPPTNWSSMNNIQRGQWIRANANLKWWEYWMDRFARMYAQIRQVFVETRPLEWYAGTIISQDTSSTYCDGINSPVGMENLTAFAQYNSFDHYYIDCEWGGPEQGRRQAYVAGLVKSKIPEAHCIIGTSIQDWGAVRSVWEWKQEILAQMQTYVWKNGTRYKAVDSRWLLVWCPTTTTWSDVEYHGQEMANWVISMNNLFSRDIEPVWLGPVDVLPIYHRGNGLGYPSANFTFAQFADVLNIRNHPEYITSEWGTIFLDAVRDYGRSAKGCYSQVISLFASGDLNVLYHGYGADAQFANTIFEGEGDPECMATFHLTNPGAGTTNSLYVLSQASITDPYARWIVSGYYGQNYVTDEGGALNHTEGFIPIIMYNDGYVELGLFYNATSARFFYGKTWSGTSWTPEVRVPREIINRGIYWVSECPINSSEPLLDLKIFKSSDGTIFISAMNLKDFTNDLSFTLKIDAAILGLSEPGNYIFYWQSIWNGTNYFNILDWSNIQATLSNGADILVIKHI